MDSAKLDYYITGGKGILIRDTGNVPESHLNEELILMDSLKDLLLEHFDSENAFVSDNIWATQSFSIEVTAAVVGDRLLCVLGNFLNKNAHNYWIICVVRDRLIRGKSGQRPQFLGRFVLGSDRITIEESLRSLWYSQIGNNSSYTFSNALH